MDFRYLICYSKLKILTNVKNRKRRAIEIPSFSDQIREVRRRLGLSQEALARAIDVSFCTINRWENGQVRPSRMGRTQFAAFCDRMRREGKLDDPISM
jgi:DNA-binding transcriptional regulator YiaG